MSPNRKVKRVVLTPEQKVRHRGVPDEFKNCPTIDELLASGDYEDPVLNVHYFDLRRVIARLRKAREEAGLSLADLAQRCGIDRAALNKLELGKSVNPTLNTLYRYAAAVGKRLVLDTAEDEDSQPAPRRGRKATAQGKAGRWQREQA